MTKRKRWTKKSRVQSLKKFLREAENPEPRPIFIGRVAYKEKLVEVLRACGFKVVEHRWVDDRFSAAKKDNWQAYTVIPKTVEEELALRRWFKRTSDGTLKRATEETKKGGSNGS